MAFKNFWFAGSMYYDIGAGLLPFSITSGDATLAAVLAMLIANRSCDDTFDLGVILKMVPLLPAMSVGS
jgi:hypothetical protein